MQAVRGECHTAVFGATLVYTRCLSSRKGRFFDFVLV